MKCESCGTTLQKRSQPQNNSLWKYFTLKAEQLEEAGLDIRDVIKDDFEIPFTKDSFHDLIWIPVQKAMYKTKRTRDLNKIDGSINEIHKVIERELAEKHGLDFIKFPSKCSVCKHIDCLCDETA